MENTLLVRKIVEKVAREVFDWSVKSSNMHPSDADAFLGDYPHKREFKKENEYDPKTGAIVKNDEIGDFPTYLQQWDSFDYVEEDEDVRRDNGIGLAKIVMQQITPIKS